MEELRRLLKTEVRARQVGDQKRLAGYAAKYGVRSHVIGGQFREIINSGAFDRVLRTSPDVVALINHDANKVLGRTTSGTLRLRSDSVGLAFDLDLPNTSYATDLYASVQRGDISGCSFAFQVSPEMQHWDHYDDEPEENPNDGDNRWLPLRVISDFKALADISIVTNPAYPETSVDARELELAVEARSQQQGKRHWRMVPVWRSACEHQGINPDTVSLPELVATIKCNEQQTVARRRAIINELLS
jgi:Escherichia/Staphylococcus phage prohead protease